MKEIQQVLKEKMEALERLRKEVDALHVVLPLLDDDDSSGIDDTRAGRHFQGPGEINSETQVTLDSTTN